MSTSSASNPTPERPSEQRVITHDLHSVHLSEDVVGDTTIRPLRPELRQQIRPRPELLLRTPPAGTNQGS